MEYITADQLAERPGARELSQVATRADQRPVDWALMEATLRGADRTAWDVDEVALADDAMQRIEDAVIEAQSLIDGHLARRGYTLPLDPVPELVTGWTRDIARYLLHKDRSGVDAADAVGRGYRDAMKLLEMTATGKFSLGASDPISTDPNTVDVRFESQPNVFDREQLGNFR